MGNNETLWVVDTSAWIFALRKRPVEAVKKRVDELLALDAAAIVGMIELELLGGTKTEEEFDRLKSRLEALHRLVTEEAHWSEAGRVAYQLRRKGVTVAFTDILIATIAKANKVGVVHADDDYDRISKYTGLIAESYVKAVAGK